MTEEQNKKNQKIPVIPSVPDVSERLEEPITEVVARPRDKTTKEGVKNGFFKKKECRDCEKTKIEMEEYKSGWQRALADYKNLQKETTARMGEWAQMSERQILEEFIPVYDHLKMAINNERLIDKKDPWLEGVRYVAKQFEGILKAHNVEEINTVGEKFDPRFHEAVGEEAVEGQEQGIILKQIDDGYKMGDRVIKPAKVIVVK